MVVRRPMHFTEIIQNPEGNSASKKLREKRSAIDCSVGCIMKTHHKRIMEKHQYWSMASEAPQKDCSPELQSIYCSENMMEHLVFYQAELEVVKSRCGRCTESVLIYTLIFLNMINQLNGQYKIRTAMSRESTKIGSGQCWKLRPSLPWSILCFRRLVK